MVIALIALLIQVLTFGAVNEQTITVIPPMPMYSPTISVGVINERDDWELYNQEAHYDYASEFTALFNSYEVKRARNGAMMIKRAGDKSFKFAKKGS